MLNAMQPRWRRGRDPTTPSFDSVRFFFYFSWNKHRFITREILRVWDGPRPFFVPHPPLFSPGGRRAW